jgi:chitin synthase
VFLGDSTPVQDFIREVFDKYGTSGGDATVDFNVLRNNVEFQEEFVRVMECMDGLMLRGFVDHRNDIECIVPNYILLAAAAVLVSIIGFKFLAALQLGTRRLPENHEKFVICQVPCYTEGESSLLKTINALALLDYDDKRKLLFVICDGE